MLLWLRCTLPCTLCMLMFEMPTANTFARMQEVLNGIANLNKTGPNKDRWEVRHAACGSPYAACLDKQSRNRWGRSQTTRRFLYEELHALSHAQVRKEYQK